MAIDERDAKNGQIIKSTGRPVGARNRLQADVVAKLQADFAAHGEGVINIVRTERPADYLKIIASVLPKEFVHTDNSLDTMSDEEIIDVLDQLRALRARQIGSGAQAASGEPEIATPSRRRLRNLRARVSEDQDQAR